MKKRTLISKELRDKIIELRRKGLSSRKVSEKLGISRSKVVYHSIKNLGRMMLIRDVDTSGVKNKQEDLGEFLGMFAADGNYYKSGHKYVIRITLSLDEEKYLKKSADKFEKLFDKRPIIYTHNGGRALVLRYNSRRIKDLIDEYLIWEKRKTHTVRLRSLNQTDDFLKGFLRGILDCDGYVYPTKTSQLCGTSRKLIVQINKIVRRLGYKSKFRCYVDKRSNKKPMYFVVLYKEEGKNFLERIQPSNPKRWVQGDLNSYH